MITRKDVDELLRDVRKRKFESLRSQAIVAIVAGVFAAGGAYIVTRSQNYATRQDLAEITNIAESIRGKISDASWQSQRFWEEKKLLYVDMIKALHQISNGAA